MYSCVYSGKYKQPLKEISQLWLPLDLRGCQRLRGQRPAALEMGASLASASQIQHLFGALFHVLIILMEITSILYF